MHILQSSDKSFDIYHAIDSLPVIFLWYVQYYKHLLDTILQHYRFDLQKFNHDYILKNLMVPMNIKMHKLDTNSYPY